MATQFGQNAQPDANGVTGWTVQGSAAQTSLDLGAPSAGYAQAGITASTAALTTSGNGTPGLAYPPSNNTSASNSDQILANPGYGDVSPSLITPGTALSASILPMPASGTAFRNPSALRCTVVISGGTLAEVAVNGVQLGTGDGIYTVPGGGTITLTYSAAPTWAWTTL